LVDFLDIWYGGNAIQVDLEAIIFNPISLTILKWLRFTVVRWRHDFQPCTAMVWDCLIVGLLLGLLGCWVVGLFGYITYTLANVAMAIIACSDVCRESRHISSSQNYCLFKYSELLIIWCNGGEEGHDSPKTLAKTKIVKTQYKMD
jgi:hypothetical protein